MSNERLYDRLPLPVAQVLRDVARWRSDVLNERAECAEDELRNLAQSADELDRWEGELDRGDRVIIMDHRIYRNAQPKLVLVPMEMEEETESVVHECNRISMTWDGPESDRPWFCSHCGRTMEAPIGEDDDEVDS